MRNGGIQIRVSDMLFILRKRWKTIAGLTLLGLLFGLALSGMTYVQTSFQTFEITGSFAITTQNEEGRYINGSLAATNNDFHLAEDMVDAVRYVILSEKVLGDVITDQSLLGVTVDQLRSNLTLTQYKDTQILEMTLTWRTPSEGLEIWNALCAVATRQIPAVLMVGSLEPINAAQALQVGVGGSASLQLWMLLALLGFAAGVGIALMELLVHPTLNNVRDVETVLGLETIGVIPQDNRFFRQQGSLLSPESASSAVVQSYSAAAYILRNRLGTREQHHCFFVTSAATGEGKTSAAANLAVQLSDMGHRTLLIDFNTRNPGLGALFLPEVDYAHSLNALYRGEATLDEAITTLTGYLDLLPTVLEHNPIPMDSAVEDLFRQLTEKYAYVIIDAGPVGQVSDTLSLNRVASAVLFVVGYDSATLPDIQASIEKLDKSGTRVVGCIVNGVTHGKARRDDTPRPRRVKAAPPAEPFAPTPDPQLIDTLNPAPAPAPSAAQAKPRDVMAELIGPRQTPPASDDEVMNALLNMGGTQSSDATPPEAT
ncbi:MAG: AAA family ATPase [Clostridia bacterium]|nr:AAA family ATPase [Clostridia bacterium]